MLVSSTTLEFHSFDAITAEAVTGSELSPHELPILIYSDYSARVIPPRLQYLKTLNTHVTCDGSIPDVAHNATTFSCSLRPQEHAHHRESVFFIFIIE